MRANEPRLPASRRVALVCSPDASRLSRLSHLLDEARLTAIAVVGLPAALRVLEHEEVDVVLVDLSDPEPDGALVRAVAARTSAPILAFGASTRDLASILQAGAAHVGTLRDGLRPLVWEADRLAAPGMPVGALVGGDLVIDVDAGEAWYDGMRLDLSPVQLRLLAILAAADGEVVPNEELHRALFGTGGYRGERLASQVLRLRTQLARAGARHERVAWVAGVGYRLQPD